MRDERLLEKLARQMVYLDRVMLDARRRGEYEYAATLEEQRVVIQGQRSAMLRAHLVMYDDEAPS
jgi:hypothetical protein